MEVSTLFQALPEDGCLVACEKDEGPLQLAREFWRKAGIAHKVKECRDAFSWYLQAHASV
jgi:predicted O-methyltransferase YrrM